MAQPTPAAAYGEMENVADIDEIRSLFSSLLPYLTPQQPAEPDPAVQMAAEPTPLADARLKAVRTQLSRFPGQEMPEEEMI
tara:strand:- start:269 stop:511 length:243 start_codon:yes stop_codon:yes gene_type:complete